MILYLHVYFIFPTLHQNSICVFYFICSCISCVYILVYALYSCLNNKPISTFFPVFFFFTPMLILFYARRIIKSISLHTVQRMLVSVTNTIWIYIEYTSKI